MSSYEQTRDDIRRRDARLFVGFGSSQAPGCAAIEALHRDWPMPLGIVWYGLIGNGDEIQIFNSFVFERFRRCGLRTWLHEQLLRAYPATTRIITGSGTRSGLAWLKAAGFKKCSAGYEFRRKIKPQRRRA